MPKPSKHDGHTHRSEDDDKSLKCGFLPEKPTVFGHDNWSRKGDERLSPSAVQAEYDRAFLGGNRSPQASFQFWSAPKVEEENINTAIQAIPPAPNGDREAYKDAFPKLGSQRP